MKTVTAEQLKEWISKGEAVLVDVREPAEFNAQHIPNAIPIPLSQISTDKLPPHQGKKLVFQCQMGKRGGMACDKVAALGNQADIYNLDGGIVAWSKAGYEVKTSGRYVLPLDRQVQLIVGLSVLFGSIMAAMGHGGFLLLTGFFGLGLTFAGLTGFCGLAMLLARMPWNAKSPAHTPLLLLLPSPWRWPILSARSQPLGFAKRLHACSADWCRRIYRLPCRLRPFGARGRGYRHRQS